MDMHGAAGIVRSKCERGLALDHPPFASTIEVTCIGIGRSMSTYVLDKILAAAGRLELASRGGSHSGASVAGGS